MSSFDQVPIRINDGNWTPWEGAVEVVGKNGDSLFWTTSGVHGCDPSFIVMATNTHNALVCALIECARYFEDIDHARLLSVCDGALKKVRKSGQLRQFARNALHDAEDYRRWAHEATNPHRKRQYEQWADNREDDASFYLARAGWNEITVEYQEAAE